MKSFMLPRPWSVTIGYRTIAVLAQSDEDAREQARLAWKVHNGSKPMPTIKDVEPYDNWGNGCCCGMCPEMPKRLS